MSGRALVTGGAGFIGSHVADLLIANGFDGDRHRQPRRAEVARTFRAWRRFTRWTSATERAARIVRESGVRRDRATSRRRSTCARAWPIRAYDARVNIVGTLNLLEAVRQSGAPTRFVFSSTGGALYGDLVAPPTSEEASKDPRVALRHRRSSVSSTTSAYYARVHGLDAVALRYSATCTGRDRTRTAKRASSRSSATASSTGRR